MSNSLKWKNLFLIFFQIANVLKTLLSSQCNPANQMYLVIRSNAMMALADLADTPDILSNFHGDNKELTDDLLKKLTIPQNWIKH